MLVALRRSLGLLRSTKTMEISLRLKTLVEDLGPLLLVDRIH